MKKEPTSEPVRLSQGNTSGPFRLAELLLCGAAVILGFLYLYDHLPLGVLLPVYTVFFAAIAVLRLLDSRRTGQKNTAARLTICSWFFLAAASLVITVLYFC